MELKLVKSAYLLKNSKDIDTVEMCGAQAKTTVKQVVDIYEPYIKLLGEELQELYGLALVHGWKSSRTEQGKKCRADIEELRRMAGK